MLRMYNISFAAMGSACELKLYCGQKTMARRIAEKVIDDVRRLEKCYSRYREDSLLSRINSAAARGSSVTVDSETGALLDYAFSCYEVSGGLFDISSGILRRAWDFNANRLPQPSRIQALLVKVGLEKIHWRMPELEFTVPGMELDFGGIGKEYAADRAATICLEQGVWHGLVTLGGDIKIIGPHPDGSPWRAGIRHPRRPDSLMATVLLRQGALTSSGDYERYMLVKGKRYCHLLNPKTGWPVTDLCAVTTVANQCLVSGSGSTIAMLKGVTGPKWLEQSGIQGIWMDEQGRLGGNLNQSSFAVDETPIQAQATADPIASSEAF